MELLPASLYRRTGPGQKPWKKCNHVEHLGVGTRTVLQCTLMNWVRDFTEVSTDTSSGLLWTRIGTIKYQTKWVSSPAEYL